MRETTAGVGKLCEVEGFDLLFFPSVLSSSPSVSGGVSESGGVSVSGGVSESKKAVRTRCLSSE